MVGVLFNPFSLGQLPKLVHLDVPYRALHNYFQFIEIITPEGEGAITLNVTIP